MDLQARSLEPLRSAMSWIPRGIPGDEFCIDISSNMYDINISTYKTTYDKMKAQRTILQNEMDRIAELRKEYREHQNILDVIEWLIYSLLQAPFGSILERASNAIPSLHKFLTGNLPSKILKMCQRTLSASAVLSGVLSIFSTTIPITDNKSDPEPPKQTPPELDEILVLCKICEEYVPLSLIEAHSNKCIKAFEKENKIISVGEKIRKLQHAIREIILKPVWPGDRDMCISTLLPMLHITFLLENVAVAPVSGSAEGRYVIEMIKQALGKIHVKHATSESLVAKARELTADKLKMCSDTREVVQRTPIRNVTIADFKFIKFISSGAYARVFLGQKTKSGDFYAIKVIPKSSLQQKNQMRRLLNEKDILYGNENKYIVSFYYSIVGIHNIYIVMEYLPGGDLSSLLDNVGQLDEDSTKTYICQVICALETLHRQKIVHRDIKPDNILITNEGTVKLTDFGLSLYGSTDRTINPEDLEETRDNEACVGTPDYLAPEVILSQPHSVTADYWSLGALIYELSVGLPPFHRDTVEATFAAILRGEIDWSELDENTPELKSLVKALLEPDQNRRLGANGIHEIKEHPWFADVDWGDLDLRDPPFIPKLQNPLDTTLFIAKSAKGYDNKDIVDDIRMAMSGEYESNPADEALSLFKTIDVKRLYEETNQNARQLRNAQKRLKSEQSVEEQ